MPGIGEYLLINNLVNNKIYQYLSDENVYTNVAIMRGIDQYLLMKYLVNNKIYQYLSDEIFFSLNIFFYKLSQK